MRFTKSMIIYIVEVILFMLLVILGYHFDNILISLIFAIMTFVANLVVSRMELKRIANAMNIYMENKEYKKAITYLEQQIKKNFGLMSTNSCLGMLIQLYMIDDQAIEAKKLLISIHRLNHTRSLMYTRLVLAVAEENEEKINYYARKVLKLKNKNYDIQKLNAEKMLKMIQTNTYDQELYDNTNIPLVKKICQKVKGEDVAIDSLAIYKPVVERMHCTGLKRVIKLLLNILSILTLVFVGLILYSFYNMESLHWVTISKLQQESLWICYLFLPIPLCNIVYGFYLKTNNYKFVSNIIIGIIFSILLVIYGSMFIVNEGFYDEQKDYIYDLTESMGISLSDNITTISFDYTEDEQDSENVFIKKSHHVYINDVDIDQINSDIWVDTINNIDLYPELIKNNLSDCEKYLIYCVDNLEYHPKEFICNNNYIICGYDKIMETIIIYEIIYI